MLRPMNVIAEILLIIGGLNWGILGIFNVNVVASIFGGPDFWLTRLVYIVVGIAAVYGLYLLKPVSEDPRGVPHSQV